jgi:tetratricopeptide (TPR) repeat protein
MGLVRKELVRPARAAFAGEDAFRFRHLLVRDVAYDTLPKERRAELNERFAFWLEQKAGERLAEYEEIVGYHFEHAHRYLAEPGSLDERGDALARAAAERLLVSGRRAFARGDTPAAVNLLERASVLLPTGDPVRLEAQPDLGSALLAFGELARAEAVLTAALDAARTAGDASGVARAWNTLSRMLMWVGRCEDSVEATERAISSAERAREPSEKRSALNWLPWPLALGPLPAEAALLRCQEIGDAAEPGGHVEAAVR